MVCEGQAGGCPFEFSPGLQWLRSSPNDEANSRNLSDTQRWLCGVRWLQHGRVGGGADRRRFAEDRPFVHVAAVAEQTHGQRSVNETTLALDAY